ncbi:MAG: AAA family ATPase [Bacillota bacterium]|nr:AAA family ATPase [Bacillota bacterium]
MEKLKLVIIGDDENRRSLLRSVLSSDQSGVTGTFETNQIQKAVALRPDAVIFLSDEGVFSTAGKISESLAGCPMLLAAEEVDANLMSMAMRSGMRGVFAVSDKTENILRIIIPAVEAERSRMKSTSSQRYTRGTVVTVFSGKGGVGKTTIAVNIATALARMGKRVAILDADLQFGDVGLMLDMEPKDTIAELVQEQGSLDVDTVKSFCLLHHSGINVLCAPKSPECADYITAHHIETIIGIMRTAFDFIIIDTPPSFNDTTLAAIECSDRILLVAGVDISTLKNARSCVGTFASLQQRDKLRIVINCEQPSMITVKDVEQMLDMPIFARIKSDNRTALDCLNRGTPVVCALPHSKLAKEFSALAVKLTTEEA